MNKKDIQIVIDAIQSLTDEEVTQLQKYILKNDSGKKPVKKAKKLYYQTNPKNEDARH